MIVVLFAILPSECYLNANRSYIHRGAVNKNQHWPVFHLIFLHYFFCNSLNLWICSFNSPPYGQSNLWACVYIYYYYYNIRNRRCKTFNIIQTFKTNRHHALLFAQVMLLWYLIIVHTLYYYYYYIIMLLHQAFWVSWLNTYTRVSVWNAGVSIL